MDGDATKPPVDSHDAQQPEGISGPQAAEAPTPDMPQPGQAPQQETSQAFLSTSRQPQPAADDGLPDSIAWTASEFIAHEKTAKWYVLLTLCAIAAAAVVWVFTRDPIPTAAVFVGIELLVYYASHQPRQLHYRLDASGLTIGNRHLPYHDFHSFAVVPEGAFLSIELTPLKRFAMYTTIYFDPAEEDRIVGFLSNHLPMEAGRVSLTDNFMRRIHF